jgi:DNA polymerase IV
MTALLCLSSFPKAFLHVDGDSFFASCETVMHPELKGKPVVVGKERGIATALTYEAKALGVRRGMMVSRIKEICPQCIVMNSDYETYSLFSLKMLSVVRRYTSLVEEYSIDECFAELTGLRRPLRMSYPEIARSIKHDLETELGFTFSLGLAPTKMVAKLGSKMNKPSGLTVLPGKLLHKKLEGLPIEALNGVGECTASFLRQHGVHTVLDFAYKDERWMEEIRLPKPYRELWWELHGRSVRPINITPQKPKSIMKSRTFKPTHDRSHIYAELLKNIEDACAKARRHNVRARELSVYLKTNEFMYHGTHIRLTLSTSTPSEIRSEIDSIFDTHLFRAGTLYRSSGIYLRSLEWGGVQGDLFGTSEKLKKEEKVYQAVDRINKKYGKYTVRKASLERVLSRKEDGNRKRRLRIPYLGEAA